MSCRAFGLKLEHQALKNISDQYNISNFKIHYDKNDRNKIVLPFFKGFDEVEIEVAKSEAI